MLEAFDHDGIVKFKDVFKTSDQKICMITEYFEVEEGDLSLLLEKRKQQELKIPRGSVKSYMA